MQTYELTVQNRAVNANSKDTTLVRTSVGIDQIHVLFDNEEWLGFPITVTFAQGSELITRSLVVSSVDSSDWVCEATVPIPWEVIDTNGPIRITFQGTDSNGNHIITAKGSPLRVEEAGDVTMGEVPSDAPTIDQWQEAYAQAMAAANDARSAAQALNTQADQIIETLQAQLQEYIDSVPEYQLPVASSETLGGIKVGSGLEIQNDGTLSASGSGMTVGQSNALTNLSMLAWYCFDTEFETTGLLKSNAMVKPAAIPVMTTESLGVAKVDGTSITLDSENRLTLAYTLADDTEY